jgi:hypothetical protein
VRGEALGQAPARRAQHGREAAERRRVPCENPEVAAEGQVGGALVALLRLRGLVRRAGDQGRRAPCTSPAYFLIAASLTT